MAGIGFYCDTGALTLTSATAETLLQIVAATNTRVKLNRVDISSDGITPTDPGIRVDILLQTTAGTMSALTPVKIVSSDSETLQTTAQKTATAEPSASTVIYTTYYNQQTWQPLIFDPPLIIVGGTRVGVRVTPGTLTGTVHAATTATCEE